MQVNFKTRDAAVRYALGDCCDAVAPVVIKGLDYGKVVYWVDDGEHGVDLRSYESVVWEKRPVERMAI